MLFPLRDRSRWVAALLLCLGAFTVPQPTAASFDEICDDFSAGGTGTLADLFCLFYKAFFDTDTRKQQSDEQGRADTITRPVANTQRMANRFATLQPGEPTEGGRMTRTIWTGYQAPAAERVVVHTYGSEIDTVLAAYRGTALNNITRLSGNDNKAVTGASGLTNRHSLVQFNTVSGAIYSLQIGSRAQAEGDISVNVFRFPPTGGVSAFLLGFAGSSYHGRDYYCEVTTTQTTILCDATFIVHNSTNQTLTVTSRTTFGGGVTGPAPFSLLPGAARQVTISVTPAIARSVRTVSGNFVFTGRAGTKIVTEARVRGLLKVAPNAPIHDLVRAEVTPTIKAGHVNELHQFTAKVINTGNVTGIECHVRSTAFSYLTTSFYRVHPVTGVRLGANNLPFDIAAGQSLSFRVQMASVRARDGDQLNREVIADCANHTTLEAPLRGSFDVSAWSQATALPSIDVTASTPAITGTLVAGGTAIWRIKTVNRGATASLSARAAYVGRFDDPANSAFQAQICRANASTGACIGPYGPEAIYTATRNATVAFNLRVTAPVVNPGSDPDQRRIYAVFKQADTPYLHAGAPSIAVRKP